MLRHFGGKRIQWSTLVQLQTKQSRTYHLATFARLSSPSTLIRDLQYWHCHYHCYSRDTCNSHHILGQQLHGVPLTQTTTRLTRSYHNIANSCPTATIPSQSRQLSTDSNMSVYKQANEVFYHDNDHGKASSRPQPLVHLGLKTGATQAHLDKVGTGLTKTSAAFGNTAINSKPNSWASQRTKHHVDSVIHRVPLHSAHTNGGSHQHHSKHRASKGLMRALSGSSGFSESLSRTERAPSPQLDDIQKLRQAVYFNENDFDDDLDIDFEDDFLDNSSSTDKASSTTNSTINLRNVPSFPTNRSLSGGSNSSVSKPFKPPGLINKGQDPPSATVFAKPQNKPMPLPISKLPKQEVIDLCASSNDVVSSAPIPWSSSPVESELPRTISTSNNFASLERKRPSIIPSNMDPPVKKPRTLPWTTRKEEEARLATAENERQEREKQKEQQLKALKDHRVKLEHKPSRISLKTPAKSYPWDTTASAVKAAQKNLKGQRVSISSVLSEEGEKKKKRQVAKIFLSTEQKRVIDLVVNSGKSVFFTGSAGTGKSVLLREIILALRKKHSRDPDRVAVTASTGLAACNVGGITLHSFAGIGLGKEPIDQLVKKIKRNNKAKTRWLRTKVLIIDEVSMVDGDLFDKLEGVARNIKNNGRPFGGIQLIVTGDFFQLPPVPEGGKVSKFAFEAHTWNGSIDHTIGLTHIFRQKDPVFANMLNEMRLGKLSTESIEAFKKLSRTITYTDGLEATELFPTRNEVENANNTRLRQLPGDSHVFTARDESKFLDEAQRNKLLSNYMAPGILELKLNAQVMLIKNLDETLVNGSLGRVIGFMSEKTYALMTSDENEGYDSDGEAADESQIMKKAQLYAAKQGKADTSPQLPYVQFTMPDGTARCTLMHYETWKTELPTGEVQASRAQLPLILAWAISIHKAQGQTLERVTVDLGRVFEKGQAYVALSRATSQAGLQVKRFDAKRVMAHDKVRAFYESLYSVGEAGSKRNAANKENEFDEDEAAAMYREQEEWDQQYPEPQHRSASRAYA